MRHFYCFFNLTFVIEKYSVTMHDMYSYPTWIEIRMSALGANGKKKSKSVLIAARLSTFPCHEAKSSSSTAALCMVCHCHHSSAMWNNEILLLICLFSLVFTAFFRVRRKHPKVSLFALRLVPFRFAMRKTSVCVSMMFVCNLVALPRTPMWP